jgi:adenylate kinase
VGDLLRVQIDDNLQYREKVGEAFDAFKFVDDDVVIELVKREILQAEKDKLSWIVEGFPRTLCQAMALQSLQIMPDKIIHLNIDKRTSLQRIRNNCNDEASYVNFKQLDEIAANVFWEHE